MSKQAERAGRPDVAELVRQGRLKYNATRGLDPNPNPAIGQVANPESGMRAGLTPEKYHKLVLLSERRRRMGKESEFVPELEDHEWDLYISWLKSGGPKKMRATGKEIGRSQAYEASQLLRKYDPANAAKLAALPEHPRAQVREAIGTLGPVSTVEDDISEASGADFHDTEHSEETVDVSEEEIESDVAPEARVPAPSPAEAPGYESIDADKEEAIPTVAAPRSRKGRGPNKA